MWAKVKPMYERCSSEPEVLPLVSSSLTNLIHWRPIGGAAVILGELWTGMSSYIFKDSETLFLSLITSYLSLALNVGEPVDRELQRLLV